MRDRKRTKTRAAFTDGNAPAPETMAVDATPRAADVFAGVPGGSFTVEHRACDGRIRMRVNGRLVEEED